MPWSVCGKPNPYRLLEPVESQLWFGTGTALVEGKSVKMKENKDSMTSFLI